jgi:hypothetical protein
MNYRRTSNGLKPRQVTELKAGWDHAARIGHPLNAFITIRPTWLNEPSAFCALAKQVRNKLGTYARQHGFPFVAAWSRECHSDGQQNASATVLSANFGLRFQRASISKMSSTCALLSCDQRRIGRAGSCC